MPAALPPSSGYTYAVELSADEALAAGATAVRFSQPVFQYVENFLGFPVGGIVPVGSHDPIKAAWIPSANGRVIKILSLSGGLAQLDTTGAGSADNGVALGVTDAERQQLATLYRAGQGLWRVPITHFSPWDYNWPYGPPTDAKAPTTPDPNANRPSDPQNKPNTACGSSIGCETQTLGEAVSVTGTPFRLHYQSDRTPGNKEVYTVQIPLSGASMPASLKRIDLEVLVAGQRVTQSFTAAPNQTTTFTWNGQDVYGRPLQGLQLVTVRIGYVYDAVYQQPAQFAQSFARLSGVPIAGSRARQEITLWQNSQSAIGAWDARAHGLGGWSLSVHHAYDLAGKVLYTGDGGRRSAEGSLTITTVAGNGTSGFSGDGGPAMQASLSDPRGVAVGPDASLYITDYPNTRIRRVGPDGIITTVAGNGSFGFSGDGGPATQASLSSPAGVAVGPDGSLYIATSNARIRRVAPALPGLSVGDTVIPAEDGSEVYVFDAAGRHLRTLHALTGAIRYAFTYDTAGHLASVTDGDGNVTTIARDGNGNPTAIIAPFGQRTTLSLDANGYLASITNPAGESTQMNYTADGLLTRFATPNGHASQMTYDALGRLQQDADAAGGSQTLARTTFATGYDVTRTTALNRTTRYHAERLSTGEQRRTTTAPDGTQTQVQIGTNGSHVTTLPDGTVSNLLEGPDPRFAMQAPLPQSLTTTRGGLTATITTVRTVSLADPNNPLSLTALTETVRVNGRTYTSSYTAATKTMATTTPAGRQRLATINTLGHLVQEQVAGLLPTG
jgi:YD repeat-containing protein